MFCFPILYVFVFNVVCIFLFVYLCKNPQPVRNNVISHPCPWDSQWDNQPSPAMLISRKKKPCAFNVRRRYYNRRCLSTITTMPVLLLSLLRHAAKHIFICYPLALFLSNLSYSSKRSCLILKQFTNTPSSPSPPPSFKNNS